MGGPLKQSRASVESYLPHFEEETRLLISSLFVTLLYYFQKFVYK